MMLLALMLAAMLGGATEAAAAATVEVMSAALAATAVLVAVALAWVALRPHYTMCVFVHLHWVQMGAARCFSRWDSGGLSW